MADLGVDFSFARIAAADIKAQGYDFVCRYLASAASKRITVAEVTDFQNNGLGIVLVWEDEANAALGGFVKGQADAREALNQAGAIGFPASAAIYFAVDFDATETQQTLINAYFDGIISVLGLARTGGYGGYYVIKRLFDAGKITYGWQAVAWSGGQVDPRIHIYQNGGSAFNGNADIDEARTTNFGQWGEGRNMSTIADQDIIDSLAHAYLGDDIANNPGLKFYIGQPVENVIKTFNNAPERAAYLKQIAAWEAEATKVPVTVKPKPLPQLVNNTPPAVNNSPVNPQPNFLTRFWRAIWGSK